MDNLYYKTKLYLEANSKTESEFDSNIELRNDSDGNGDYIKVWNVSGLAKPSDTQLNSYASNATKENNNSIIRQNRKASYGSIGDQLDLLSKDMFADKGDKTGESFKAIKAVKDANAKE